MEFFLLVVGQKRLTLGIEGDNSDVDCVQDRRKQHFAIPARREQLPQSLVTLPDTLLLDSGIRAREPNGDCNSKHHQRQDDNREHVGGGGLWQVRNERRQGNY